MQHALELAERGRGRVEPNPLVGAVVVRDGKLVGEGWHEQFAGPHAEVHALRQAGEAARGATLYVTLEPCCHFGKTPPCTDAIRGAGVAHVVAAMRDPFPEVAGKGISQLAAAGIDVKVGVEETAARRLNAPYLKVITAGRPYVHAKWAMTLDGKIATSAGDSKWISNRASREIVHALRGRMDAIVVGIGTALADDPLLTARPPGPRTPVRIVLDSHARLPIDSQLVRTIKDAALLVAITDKAEVTQRQVLEKHGCEILCLPAINDQSSLPALLAELGRRRLTNILVEGGSTVLGSFSDANAIDEVHVFVAARLVGGANAPTPLGGQGVQRLVDGTTFSGWDVRLIGDQQPADVLIHGWR